MQAKIGGGGGEVVEEDQVDRKEINVHRETTKTSSRIIQLVACCPKLQQATIRTLPEKGGEKI
jgi:hypothetical protein